MVYTTSQILNKEARGEEALERSIACYAVAIEESEEEPAVEKKKKLCSFPWIAAAACLQEVYKLPLVA